MESWHFGSPKMDWQMGNASLGHNESCQDKPDLQTGLPLLDDFGVPRSITGAWWLALKLCQGDLCPTGCKKTRTGLDTNSSIGLFSVVFFVKRTTCQSQNLRKRATASPVVGLTEARKILGVVAPTQPRNYVVGDARCWAVLGRLWQSVCSRVWWLAPQLWNVGVPRG
jgi:hypothetical protein